MADGAGDLAGREPEMRHTAAGTGQQFAHLGPVGGDEIRSADSMRVSPRDMSK
jgi:hypothetical protein